MSAQNLNEVVEVVKVSEVVALNETGEITCEYQGCGGDCDCDGDKN